MLNFDKKMSLGLEANKEKPAEKGSRIQACPAFSSCPSLLLIPYWSLSNETSWNAIGEVSQGREGVEAAAAQPAALLGLEMGPLASLGIALTV